MKDKSSNFYFSFFNTLKLPGSGSDWENFNDFQHA